MTSAHEGRSEARHIQPRALASFLPAYIVRHHQSAPQPPVEPTVTTHGAAVLFADVEGFTPLTERFARQGSAGAERVHLLLNSFYDKLVRIILDHGGDVVNFAGDAALAVWSSRTEEELVTSTRLAAQCGRVAQDELDCNDVREDVHLRMRIGIGAGEVLSATVGGIADQWQFIIAGNPLQQVGHAKKSADPGSVAISPQAWMWLKPFCTGKQIDNGHVILATIEDALTPVPPELPEPSGCEAALRSYIPAPVLEHLDAGQNDDWLAEFRRVTTVYIGLKGIDFDAPDVLSNLHSAVCTIQSHIHQLDGVLARFMMADNGTTVLAVWGLPGRTHEDDVIRATQSAIAIHADLEALSVNCGIGITSGKVLCGPQGGAGRNQYSIIGTTVNRAARLMEASENGILCDAATSEHTGRRFDLSPLKAIAVKGVDKPVAVHKLLSIQDDSPLKSEMSPADGRTSHSSFIGRDGERQLLLELTNELHEGKSRVIVVGGEPGVGKSRLIASHLEKSEQMGVRYLLGEADAIEESTAYYACRGVLAWLLKPECSSDPGEQRRYLRNQLKPEPRMASWLALLNDILPLGFPENELTIGMTKEARADSTRDLLVHLLGLSTLKAPMMVVLEDVQWMDSMSWSVAAALVERVHPLLLILVTRTGHEPLAREGKNLLHLYSNVRIELEPLSKRETQTLVCDRLGLQMVPDELIFLIYDKADGHPLFTEELAYMLRDSGVLRFDECQGGIVADLSNVSAMDLPDTIEGVITSRIDRLTSAEQMTLKVASVVGRSFSLRVVRDIHPTEADKENVPQHLRASTESDLTRLEAVSPEVQYMFKHAITKEVTYELLLPGRRQLLHRQVAQWYESEFGNDLSALYPLLAHHWSSAKDLSKAFDYLERAGEQSVHQHANSEALRFLDLALAALDDLKLPQDRTHRGHCQFLRGYATLALGELEKSSVYLRDSLALMGWPDASSPSLRILCIFGHLLRQVRNRLLYRWVIGRSRHDPEVIKEGAQASLRLSHIAYFSNDIPRLVYHSLRCLNLAEKLGPSSELALIYAGMASTAGAVSMHRLARHYRDLALRVVNQLDDPATSGLVMLFLAIYGNCVADWNRSMTMVERAFELNTMIGDNRRTEECMVTAGYLHYHRGDFKQSEKYFYELATAGRERRDNQTTGWGLLGVARIQLARRRYEEASTTLQEASAYVVDDLSRIEICGLLAATHAGRGFVGETLEAANQGLDLVLKAWPISFSTLTGTTCIVEAFLYLWDLASEGKYDGDKRQLMRCVRRSCKGMRRFAGVFPIGRPQAYLRQGQLDWIVGRRRRALALWRKGLHVADVLQMPYDAALIHVELERRIGGEEGKVSRAAAGAIFAQLGISSGVPEVSTPPH